MSTPNLAALAADISSKLAPQDQQKLAYLLQQATPEEKPWFLDPEKAIAHFEKVGEAQFTADVESTKTAMSKYAEAQKIKGDLITGGRYLCVGFMDQLIKESAALLAQQQAAPADVTSEVKSIVNGK